MNKYTLPDQWEEWIIKHLKGTGYSLDKPKPLADAILKVSDSYQSKTSTTDWTSPETRAAYIAYFFPLNFIRFSRVADEMKKSQFLDGIEQIVDFGCGPGPSSKIIASDPAFHFIKSIHGIDNHNEVRNDFMDTPRSDLELSFSLEKPGNNLSKSAIIASYVLNEMSSLPPWFYQAEALIILEPSTKVAFQGFNDLRTELIDKSYDIWAPCPHHDTCPLSQSKKDWCHDRVYWEKTKWFQALEKYLPMRNESLTYSYILARKKKKVESNQLRIVGDAQVEKGKTRWMLCRNEEREFLSFLSRHGKAPKIYRGDSIELSKIEKKANEVRFTHDDIISTNSDSV